MSQATAFNQDTGDWDISDVTDMSYMLASSGLSTANYDATISGWATLDAGETQIPTAVTLGAIGLEYCASTTDHDKLTDSVGSGGYAWIITDDGLNCGGARIDDSVEKTIVLGAEEQKTETTLYPNPADFSLKITDENLAGAIISIFNVQGKEILRKENLFGLKWRLKHPDLLPV